MSELRRGKYLILKVGPSDIRETFDDALEIAKKLAEHSEETYHIVRIVGIVDPPKKQHITYYED
jgi:hypothetical protein